MKLLGISGTIFGSKTLAATKKALEEARKHPSNAEIELLDLKSCKLPFCDGRPVDDYDSETKQVIQQVAAADMYIIATPILHGSFPGALKNLLDLVPAQAFRHKVIGFIAVGGNPHHYLALENQLKPIAGYLQAYVVPEYVFVHHHDFNANNEIVNPEALSKISKLSYDILNLHQALARA